MIDMSQPVHRLSNVELLSEYDELEVLEMVQALTRKQERRLEDVERECFIRGLFNN